MCLTCRTTEKEPRQGIPLSDKIWVLSFTLLFPSFFPILSTPHYFPFSKSSLNLLQYCSYFMFFGHEERGILALGQGTESTRPALEGRVLTTGLPGDSHHQSFFHPSLFLPSLPLLRVSRLGPRPPWTGTVASLPYEPLSLSAQAVLIIFSKHQFCPHSLYGGLYGLSVVLWST